MHRILASIVVLATVVSPVVADVVFVEDFQSPREYRQRYGENPGWQLTEAEIRGGKSTVLDVNGGTPVEVSTRIVRSDAARIHVSTAAQLVTTEYDAAKKTLSCEIRYPEDDGRY